MKTVVDHSDNRFKGVQSVWLGIYETSIFLNSLFRTALNKINMQSLRTQIPSYLIKLFQFLYLAQCMKLKIRTVKYALRITDCCLH